MCASSRKIAGPSAVSYDRIPSKTPVPYWSACAETCVCAASHGIRLPSFQMNLALVNGGMLYSADVNADLQTDLNTDLKPTDFAHQDATRSAPKFGVEADGCGSAHVSRLRNSRRSSSI